MAINLYNRYAARANAPSADYPFGSFKDETTALANDGTPLENDWSNDREGWDQRLLVEAGLTPSDIPDTALNTQKYDALMLLLGNNTRPQNATIQELCSGFYGIGWHDPSVYPNYVDLGVGGVEVVDSCLSWDWTTGRPLLVYATDSVDVRAASGMWHYRGAPVIDGSLGLTYPSTASHILSVASDADSLYVAWRRDSDGAIRVSKYSMNPFSTTPVWTGNTGETYAADAEFLNYFKLIIASDSHIALSMCDLSLTITAHGVAIFNKANAGMQLGQGNNTSYSTSDAKPQYGKLVSDGLHVFWIGRAGTSSLTFYLASARISDPTTSDYSLATLASGVSSTTELDKCFNGLLNIGEDDGTVIVSNPLGQINVFSKQNDTSGGGVEIQNFFEFDPSTIGYDVMIGSDGVNAFFLLYRRDLVGASPSARPGVVCYKIPLAAFGNRCVQPSTVVWDYLYPNMVSIDSAAMESDNKAGNMIFDGRDMWVVMRDGNTYRIVNTLGR